MGSRAHKAVEDVLYPQHERSSDKLHDGEAIANASCEVFCVKGAAAVDGAAVSCGVPEP